MTEFTHLHVHSHYSILDGMAKVPDLVDKCLRNGMYAMALTDHGNMFGIKELTDYAIKINGKKKDKMKALEEVLSSDGASDQEKADAQAKLDAERAVPFFTPIIGTEAYCARRSHKLKDPAVKRVLGGKERIVDRGGWHLIILAKNLVGYHNLCKLATIAYVDGFYGKPRIDHELLEQYHEGLIVCSACIAGEVPSKILDDDYEGARQSALWFKNLFGGDYYLELQRHKTDKPYANTQTFELQQQCNSQLVKLARELDIKLVCTNDSHFVEEEHAEAHDRLICLSTGADYEDPGRMRYTKQEWLKTPDEMAQIFSDLPEALANTMEVAAKIETYSIESPPIMPKFSIPASFGTEEEYRKKFSEEDLYNEFTQNENGEVVLSREDGEKKVKRLGGYNKLYRIKLEGDYLAKLAWEGAQLRYNKEGKGFSPEVVERIKFELYIMKTMGFPGYFLIVRDYIRAAREELGVSVGPGRGSAAGSAVAYCLKITDIDPIKYDLLFERFLNPDRISLPDIDVDFDDAGRGKVLQWVTEKYGKDTVAHIITYGTMATKSSIKDVCRVEKVPLPEVSRLCSFVPDKFDDSLADPKTGKVPKVSLKNCFKFVPELKAAHESNDNAVIKRALTYAEQLENTNRQIGIHACGVIIGADDLKKFAPLCTINDKDSGEDVLVTQYDGHVIESVGLIKMDFLGLSTLSIIKEALANIKRSKGVDLDIDSIPIDDAETYQLYSRGDTIATFQFESPGMQKYLRELQPTVFEDIIAMNALYRPGPMQYIPTFINRKLGREPITYDIPEMEKYLKDTYGVTVYQEQVMLLSRLLANFTRGESDKLRKAMGKKQMAILEQLKGKFIAGGTKNGHDEKVLNKIWADWEEFAKYAFNKSHATCYSWVAYQTAYLKAHFPAEFMAANLTNNKSDITKVTKFMEECKNMGLKVLGPDINESELNFSVNHQGAIRFGMGGVKGLGESAISSIIKERDKAGPFKDLYDFSERCSSSNVTRKVFEVLSLCGAFDSFSGYRREFMAANVGENGPLFSEVITKYGLVFQADSKVKAFSLFGDDEAARIPRPPMPVVKAPWDDLERLNQEKELVGIYLSAHPLDAYRVALRYVCNMHMSDFGVDEQRFYNRDLFLGGLVKSMKEMTTKKGTKGLIVTVEDFDGSHEFAFWGQEAISMRNLFDVNFAVLISGRFCKRGAYSSDDDPLVFRVSDVKLLSEVNSSLVHSLTISIAEDKLQNGLGQELSSFILQHSGQVALNFNVREVATGNIVQLSSRSLGVDLSPDFVDYLEQQQAQDVFSFRVN